MNLKSTLKDIEIIRESRLIEITKMTLTKVFTRVNSAQVLRTSTLQSTTLDLELLTIPIAAILLSLVMCTSLKRANIIIIFLTQI